MHRTSLCVLILVILLGAVMLSAGCLLNPPEEKGILKGHVTIGPLCPVEPCTVSPEVLARTYAARKVLVYTPDHGRLVAEVSLDSEGNYSVALAPAKYLVDINYSGIDRSPDVPAEVSIAPGETVILDISIDTGIR